ncbi:MAG: DNA polymerase I [Phycisphaerae bacterium]|nr:DNA polymerase I [Phycisphaerae bacterium]
MPTLYLVDGYAQFFRAYHAIRTPMTSPVTGEPTNMTFGFVGMLLKLLKHDGANLKGDAAPTHLAVALDVSGDRGTFRSELYPEYKATRSAPPEDLAPQVERCLAILEAIGVRCVGSPGYEADDVIAAIATRLRDTDARVRFISKDKDLKQLLLEGRVEMYDVHTDELITEADLMEDQGITPGQVVDMLALMGDAVDNVPGVPGIGAKTAAQLIAEFGTLDAVLAEALDEGKAKKDWAIKGKRRENIAAAAASLPLSRELVLLRSDTPIDFEFDRTSIDSLDLAPLLPILKELGFNRYQDEVKALLGDGAPQDAPSATADSKRGRAPADSLWASVDETIAAPADGSYHIVKTGAELAKLAKKLESAELVAVDTETTSIRPMLADLAGLSFAVEEGEAYYVPVRSPAQGEHLDEKTVLAALRPVLEDAAKRKVGHNIKFDLLVLRRAGVELRGVCTDGGGDTMVASYVIDASRSSHSMDALALALLNRENVSITELIGTGKKQKRFDEVELDLAGPYAAEDADVTLRLANVMLPQISEMGLTELYRDVEIPLVEVLAELEYNGILVDPDELDRQRERLETAIADLREQIDRSSLEMLDRTFDPDSPKQLGAALFNKPDHETPGLGIKPLKKTKTGYSTDAEVLQKLADDVTIESPIPRLIIEYRQLAKLVSTYLVALKDAIHPETKRIHASFNQTVAATGRLSSSDPNLQNIPIRTDVGREIRRAFVAPPGHVLITADYSQIELRLLAHLSKDPGLIEAFINGEDIHAAVAAQIHGVALGEVTKAQRSGAKMVNFGIVYGITPFGLARRLGCSNTEADEIITSYKKRFAGITTFLEECVQFAREHGYVETMLKRRRPIRDIDSNQPHRRSVAERMAINSVVQGSAADLIKLAMIDLHRLITAPASAGEAKPAEGAPGSVASSLPHCRMLLQIHDELVFECPEPHAESATAEIRGRMEQAMEVSVPLVVEAAWSGNWFEGK